LAAETASRCYCCRCLSYCPQEKKDEDEALAAKKRKRLERDPLHQGLIVARANLKSRDYQIDLASKLNKTQARGAAHSHSSDQRWPISRMPSCPHNATCCCQPTHHFHCSLFLCRLCP
jgi:hypothetical protein